MTFEEWAEEYFGRDVDVPEACRDAWDASIEKCAAELEKGISVSIEANTIFEYCAKKLRALKGK